MVIKQTSLKRENIGRPGMGMVRVWQTMRFVAVFCLAAALLIGCGGEPNLDDPKVRQKIWDEEAIDEDRLERASSEEEIYYAPGQKEPYTGWAKYVGAWKTALIQFKNGKPNGTYILWYLESKNLITKGPHKNGKRDGLWTRWDENGKKVSSETYKAGKLHGLRTEWDENGKKVSSETYKDGKKVE